MARVRIIAEYDGRTLTVGELVSYEVGSDQRHMRLEFVADNDYDDAQWDLLSVVTTARHADHPMLDEGD